MKIKIKTKDFTTALTAYAGAAQKTAEESVLEASRRLAKNLIINFPPFGARFGTGAGAKKKQVENWQRRILGHRLPRKPRGKHLTKRGSKAYYAVSLRRQGELAGAWNAAAIATGAKGVPAWIRRHGAKHGGFSLRRAPGLVSARIAGSFSGVRTARDLEFFAEKARRQTTAGLAKSASAMLSRAFAKIKK